MVEVWTVSNALASPGGVGVPDGGDGAGRSGQKSLILQVRRIDIYALQMIDTVDV